MPELREWQLFIDETGDFDDADAPVAVVGWLVQQRELPAFDRHLRSALSHVFPDGAWPPHASVFNVPINQAVLFRLHGFATADSERWRAAVPALWESLRRLQLPAVQEVVRLAEQGVFPCYQKSKAANDALANSAPDLFGKLAAQREDQARRMNSLLACLRNLFSPSESWLIGAFDPAADATSQDRYLTLLQALFVRVFALLRGQQHVVHHVKTFVARRHVQLHGVPKPVQLRIKDVGDCVRRAETFPLRPPAPGATDEHVRIVPWRVSRYDERVCPGIVIADYAANRLRGPLSSAPSWSELQSQATARVRVPIAAPACMDPNSVLPAMAANGSPAAIIVDALSRTPPASIPRTSPGWTADQAKQWANAVARWV